MVKINKETQKYISNFFLIYSIITLFFIFFLLLNTILFELSTKKQDKIQIYNRKLENEMNQINNEMNQTDNKTLLNETLSNETDIISKESKVLKKR